MNCERVRPYLTAHAAGELPAHTESWVAPHVEGCAICTSLAQRHATIGASLRALPEAALEPPPGFAAAVARRAGQEERRKPIPIPPMIPAEMIKVLTDNRDAIVGSAGVLLAGAGAAWLAWRALKSRSPRAQGA
ncbi:MAG TPA: zf-HC2 domain-containing protein [Actinomycetota bacterium]